MANKKKAKKAPAKKSSVKKTAAKKVAAKKTVKTAAKPKPLMKKTSSPAPRAAALAKKISIQSHLIPLDDRLLIEVEGAAQKTAGGLYIPGTVADRPNRGKVLAKGPGRRNKKGTLRPLDVSVGDQILFPQFAGQKVEMDGGEFLILREEEVLGIVE